MQEKQNTERTAVIRKAILSGTLLLILLVCTVSSALAWLVTQNTLLYYAPISNPQSFYIGAGHIEFEGQTYYGNEATEDRFEDIRYLYLTGIDVTDEEKEYYDYVFCVYGRSVASFNLQLAHTTNNQFSYAIFNATESKVASAGAVKYTTHGTGAADYYYTVTGPALSGGYKNAKTVDGETLGKNETDESALDENEQFHTRTYGSYSSTHVNKYAEPLYWQTTTPVSTGITRGPFVKYFILRVYVNDKSENDKETDIICIAARSS